MLIWAPSSIWAERTATISGHADDNADLQLRCLGPYIVAFAERSARCCECLLAGCGFLKVTQVQVLTEEF